MKRAAILLVFASAAFGQNSESRLRILDPAGTAHIDIISPALSGNKTYSFPAADGSSGQCLMTDGSAHWSFNTCGAGSLSPPVTLSATTSSPILTLSQSGGGDVFVAAKSGGGGLIGLGTVSPVGAGVEIYEDTSGTDMQLRIQSITTNIAGITLFGNSAFESVWSAGPTAAFDVLNSSSNHALTVLQTGGTTVSGSGAGYTAIDQTGGSSYATFYRNSGINHLVDSAFGDVLTFDSSGVTQLHNDLIIIDSSTAPHINMYGGSTFMSALAAGPTAAFGVLTQTSVQAFQVLQSGVTQVAGANGAFIVTDRVSGSASGQFFRASGTNRLTDSGFGDVITWDSTGVTQLKNDLIIIDSTSPHINMYAGGTLEAAWASGATAAFGVLTSASVQAFQVLQSGVTQVGGANGAFIVGDRVSGSASGQFFRASGTNRLTDSGFGDVITWDSTGVTQLKNDLIVIDTGVAPHINMYGGGTFMATLASGPTAAFDVLNQSVVHSFTVLQNGLIGLSQASPQFRLDSNGEISANLQSTVAQFRAQNVSSNNAVLLRNDGSDFYALISSTTTGSWNSLRPFHFNMSTGMVSMENGLSLYDATAATVNLITGSTREATLSAGVTASFDVLDASNTHSFTVFQTGKVGIGTNSPTQVLSVIGDISSGGASAALFALDRTSSGATALYRTGGINRLWDSSFGDVIQFTSFGTTDILGPLVVTGAVTFSSTLSGTHAQNLGTSDNVTFNSVTTGTNILINGGTLGVSGSTFAQLQMSAGGTLESTWSAGSTAALGVTNVSGSHIFTVFQSGIVDAGGYSSGSNLGVTCSGAPSGSFATYLGIVIHC